MNTPAKNTIEKFGGVGPLARLLGHKHPTTVQGWFDRGHIPSRQLPTVYAAAQSAGIDLDPLEMIGVEPVDGEDAA